MVTIESVRFTRDDYMRLPEGFPAQLIEGELVREPAPTYNHQRTVGRLYLAFCRLVGDDCRVVLSPIDVFVDRYNVLQSDVLVLDAALPRDVPDVGIPAMVVEVLSPSTAFHDRHRKRRIYLDAGSGRCGSLIPGRRPSRSIRERVRRSTVWTSPRSLRQFQGSSSPPGRSSGTNPGLSGGQRRPSGVRCLAMSFSPPHM